MSSETYYSPELTAQMAAQIVHECDEIINRSIEQKKSIMHISNIKITNITSTTIASDQVWDNIKGMTLQGKVSTDMEINHIATQSKGQVIDDSKLLRSDLKSVEKMLVECLPRTQNERKEKEKFLEMMYSCREVDLPLYTQIQEFCEKQLIIDDAQREIIAIYFSLLEILNKKKDAKSIEEMSHMIPEMRKEYEVYSKEKYIRDTIKEVFQMYGYEFSHTAEMTKEERVECVVSGIKNAKCYVTHTEDGFLFESVGIIRHGRTLSNDEKKQILSDEYKICSLNSQIEEELKRRGIVCHKAYDMEPSMEILKVEEIAGSSQTRYSTSGETVGALE